MVVLVGVSLHGWLNDVWVLLIVRIALGVLVGLGNVVVERRKVWAVWAGILRPVPSVRHRVHIFENGPALVNEGGGIGVLVAHLNDDSAVNVLVGLEAIVVALQIGKSVSGLFEVPLVLLDLSLVVLDVTGVLINVRGILVAEGLSVLNSVLEIGSGQSQGLGGNEHVGGLGNLELVVLSSEEGLSVLETFHLLGEVGES